MKKLFIIFGLFTMISLSCTNNKGVECITEVNDSTLVEAIDSTTIDSICFD